MALGTRRLAIVDLSEHGHQPMASPDGRYVLAFNGEIYNFVELRARARSRRLRFRGSRRTPRSSSPPSSSGVWPRPCARCNGMFGLALWDRRERRLHLARDRFGEKPLYYGWAGHSFLFGSELKALRAHPAFDGDIDRDALGAVLPPQLRPGPVLASTGVSPSSPRPRRHPRRADDTRRPCPHPVAYWSLRRRGRGRRRGSASRRSSLDDATDELDATARADAVALRMHADVPLGAFLSGGIDSSLVVALMQAQHTAKVKTFTIAFDDATYDEAADARAVADHLGTEHHELLVTGRGRPRRHPPTPRHLRRALRRLLADPHGRARPPHPRARHRGAVG